VTLGLGKVLTLTCAASATAIKWANAAGGFDVLLSYTYADELVGGIFVVEVTDVSGSTTSQSVSDFSVGDAPLHSSQADLIPPVVGVGAPFGPVTVLHFSDDNPLATADDFTAVVTLGDGNTVTLSSAAGANGQIVANAGGGFDVLLSYTYTAAVRSQTFAVHVADYGGQATSQSVSGFSVSPLGSTPADLTPPVVAEGEAIVALTVFHFTDSEPLATADDFTAVVTLGDGNVLTLTSEANANGQIVANAGGGFDVVLSYVYASALRDRTFAVEVSDAGGSTTSQSVSTFSVADAPLYSTPADLTPPVATEGVPFGPIIVLHFTDGNPFGPGRRIHRDRPVGRWP
jgi:hypothetical protein